MQTGRLISMPKLTTRCFYQTLNGMQDLQYGNNGNKAQGPLKIEVQGPLKMEIYT
jgi:hypothetical protein